MGKKEQHQQQQQRQKDHKDNDRVEAVLKHLRKQATLTVKQVGFCYFHCSFHTVHFLLLSLFSLKTLSTVLRASVFHDFPVTGLSFVVPGLHRSL